MLIFVDTNVLVYARDASEPEKQPLSAQWMRALWQTRRGCLSVQVLEEFYVTVTQKLKPGLSVDDARSEIRALGAWQPVVLRLDTMEEAWSIQDRFRISFWDALIVATAASCGCHFLLTEDLQDGQELAGITVLNPFRHRPEQYLDVESPATS